MSGVVDEFEKKALMRPDVFKPVYFSQTFSLSDPTKSLKVGRSDIATRPHFDDQIDDFLTLVDPRNTRLLVSQDRLDGPRTVFSFRSCCRPNDFGNHLLQPDKEPDKTTQLTIPSWF